MTDGALMSTAPTTTATDPRRAALQGAQAMLPLLVGVAPLGLVVGVRAAEAELPTGAGWATGLTIYGASAQLAAIDLLDRGTAPLLVIATVAVVNARLALYSTGMGPHWAGAPSGLRALAAYLLVDPSYAVATDGYTRDASPADRNRFYLSAGLTLWVGWQVITLVGTTVGSHLPSSLQLEFAVPLCLVSIVAKQVDDRPALLAAVVAALLAVAGRGLPMATGLPLAIVIALIVGSSRWAQVGGH